MKLSELNKFRIDEAYRHTTVVLNYVRTSVRTKELKGKDLEFMKLLEEVVQIFESIILRRG